VPVKEGVAGRALDIVVGALVIRLLYSSECTTTNTNFFTLPEHLVLFAADPAEGKGC
jgi:hypothetical protein